MTPEQELERADRAKRILDDELYQDGFRIVREHLTRKWAESPLGPAGTADRESYHMQLGLLTKLEGTLNYAISNGKVALFNIEVAKRRKNVGKQ